MALNDDSEIEVMQPGWNVSSQVHAAATCRQGGVSVNGYRGLNLATHVGDDPQRVGENRRRLAAALDLPQSPRWLDQVHSAVVVRADDVDLAKGGTGRVEADATWTDTPGTVCGILTADCLPVLLCDEAGTRVAAVHAGWRGLAAGIIDRVLDVFFDAGITPGQIKVWFGPAIGPTAYEVDAVVRDAFLQLEPACQGSFMESRPGHWQFSLYSAASVLLGVRQVTDISGGDLCTLSDDRFYSYRRGQPCGRQAALIWLDNPVKKK